MPPAAPQTMKMGNTAVAAKRLECGSLLPLSRAPGHPKTPASCRTPNASRSGLICVSSVFHPWPDSIFRSVLMRPQAGPPQTIKMGSGRARTPCAPPPVGSVCLRRRTAECAPYRRRPFSGRRKCYTVMDRAIILLRRIRLLTAVFIAGLVPTLLCWRLTAELAHVGATSSE